jgi:hypothetical protein
MAAPTVNGVARCLLVLGGLLLIQPAEAQLGIKPPDAPKELQPPNPTLLLRLQGKGSQIYVCQNTAGTYGWKLKAPDAKLFDESGEADGRHYAGPTWELNDGSKVKGKVLASAPSPDAGSIPWLLLTATSHEGHGVLTGVENIQRLETKGGVAPGGCAAGHEMEEKSVPYEAIYYFYGTKAPGLGGR